MRYEQKARNEIADWERKLFKPPGWLERTSKTISKRINNILPPKVHTLLTATIKSIVRTALFGAEYTPQRPVQRTSSLEAADQEAKRLLSLYQKIATRSTFENCSKWCRESERRPARGRISPSSRSSAKPQRTPIGCED